MVKSHACKFVPGVKLSRLLISNDGVLHEIVRLIDIAGERNCKGSEVWNSFEQVGAKVSRKGRSGVWEHVSPLTQGGSIFLVAGALGPTEATSRSWDRDGPPTRWPAPNTQ